MLFENLSPVASGLPAALPFKKHPRPRVANRPSAANLVLAALPHKDYQRMLTGLEPVKLIYGQVLYEPAGPIRHVYFPTDCLVSLLTAVDNQRTLEVGMVGNEGMVGMPMALGIGVSAVRALVQGSGTAMRMTAARFRAEFKKNIPLQQALFRYTHLLMAQVSQTAACNRFHQAEARLARWLLMTSDRLHADEFHLTHEFLAHMLGVRREGVTEAACVLERRKLIEYSRGNIRILDRKRLEAAACTCYRTVKNLQDRAHCLGDDEKRNGLPTRFSRRLRHAPQSDYLNNQVVGKGAHQPRLQNKPLAGQPIEPALAEPAHV